MHGSRLSLFGSATASLLGSLALVACSAGSTADTATQNQPTTAGDVLPGAPSANPGGSDAPSGQASPADPQAPVAGDPQTPATSGDPGGVDTATPADPAATADPVDPTAEPDPTTANPTDPAVPAQPDPTEPAEFPFVEEVIDVTDVWSGHPVEFGLVTRGNEQFISYYDQNQVMTVAKRTLGTGTDSSVWQTVSLPSVVGWDSHNYISMALDGAGQVHVSGNMHDDPLVYFRTTTPGDITTFEQQGMLGANESSCTYPEFFDGPSGDLVFNYRDGASGNGNTIFNALDPATGVWRRLLDAPIADGEGLRNIYPVGPTLGPDGMWHLVWVWRDTPDATTNHDLSYARSPDLINWERGDGTPLSVPITLGTADIVDPVPSGGGMINNNTIIGFDGQNRPVIAYHKYDSDGITQLYNARLENGQWQVYQTSNWDYRWDFGGGGTLVFEIIVDGVRTTPDGTLVQNWFHAQMGGNGAFELAEADLSSLAQIEPPLPYTRDLDVPQSPTEGMVVRWQPDSGQSPDPGLEYLLRWETLESNRDLPREVIPPPTRLRVYGFRQTPAP